MNKMKEGERVTHLSEGGPLRQSECQACKGRRAEGGGGGRDNTELVFVNPTALGRKGSKVYSTTTHN